MRAKQLSPPVRYLGSQRLLRQLTFSVRLHLVILFAWASLLVLIGCVKEGWLPAPQGMLGNIPAMIYGCMGMMFLSLTNVWVLMTRLVGRLNHDTRALHQAGLVLVEPEISSRWAAIGFWIPFVNFWHGERVIRELWQINLGDEDSSLVTRWMSSWVVGLIIPRIVHMSMTDVDAFWERTVGQVFQVAIFLYMWTATLHMLRRLVDHHDYLIEASEHIAQLEDLVARSGELAPAGVDDSGNTDATADADGPRFKIDF